VLEGRADIAVHTAKDLPSTTPAGLSLAAVPIRADARDALVGCRFDELPPGGAVATGSARRRAQLANLRPDLTFVELRGNMETRVRRGEDGTVSAVVVAQAALERLGWTDRAAEILSPSLLLPQVGQGAIALECRTDDDDVRSLLAEIDSVVGHAALDAERSMLAGIGGDCSVPVGAWAEVLADGGFSLHGMLASADGKVLVRARLRGADPVPLGQALARHLLEDCGGGSIQGGWVGAGGG
jgi:hydroxymethylbilane synthase